MDNNQDFKMNLIITASYYVWWFFLGNFYFALLNLPLIVLILGLGTGILVNPSVWFIALCCIPLGPSFTALMGAMGKVVTEKDVPLTKQLFKTYKNSFKQSTIIWSVMIAAITLLYVDATFFSAKGNILAYLFYILLVYVLVLSLYSLSIVSNFYLKTSKIVGVAFGYSFTHFKSTIINVLTIIAAAYIFTTFTSYSVLFLSSIFCYCIMNNNQPILKDIKERLEA